MPVSSIDHLQHMSMIIDKYLKEIVCTEIIQHWFVVFVCHIKVL